MMRFLAISFLLALALSALSGTYVNAMAFDAEGKPVGTFCKVEKVDVCVVARTEEDCTKLGGEKVDSCPMPECFYARLSHSGISDNTARSNGTL